MFWVVQENVFNEEGYANLLDALQRLEIEYTRVKFVPFQHKLIAADTDLLQFENTDAIPEIKVPEGLVMVCGATLLSMVAQEKGWVPGTFINENFHSSRWLEHWGNFMLNSQTITDQISKIQCPWDIPRIFIRPCLDTKVFTGFSMRTSDLDLWRNDLLSQGRDSHWFGPQTEVMLAPAQEINAEYRFFIVDKKVVTGSMYKLGHRLVHDPYIPDYVSDFCQQMVNIWQPSRGFVMDIAETPEGCKIIEINNLNHSGFYACDVLKIVATVNDMIW